MKVGIFGGTFNPPHKTHLQLAQSAIRQLGLDKLIVFPCGNPPHKSCFVDSAHRLQMTRLAFADVPQVVVDDFEIVSTAKSYTANTLRYVKGTYPDAQLYLLMGADSLAYLQDWYQPQAILSMAQVVVYGRKGVDLDEQIAKQSKLFGASFVVLEGVDTADNSTDIRLNYQFGLLQPSVLPQVDAYVKANGLYQQHLPMCTKLKDYLKPSRLAHTYHVVKAGLKLPSQCNPDDVFVACALHDVAKYVPSAHHARYDFEAGSLPPSVVHAFLGERVAQQDFGVTDRQILDAIKYHTTARPNMTELDMVVYVADKVEESRPYPVSHLFAPTLQQTFYNVLLEASEVVKQSGKVVHPLTQKAVDFYTQLIKEDI